MSGNIFLDLIKPIPIQKNKPAFTGRQINNNSLSLKSLKADTFERSVSFGSKNKKPREVEFEGKTYRPDGCISAAKSGLYKNIFDTILTKKLDAYQQQLFRNYFINRDFNAGKLQLGKDNTPSYPKLYNLSLSLHSAAMKLDPADPERIALLFIKDELVQSPEYKEISRQNPFFTGENLYFRDGKLSEDKQKLAKEFLQTALKEQPQADYLKLIEDYYSGKDLTFINPLDFYNSCENLRELAWNGTDNIKQILNFFYDDIKASGIFHLKNQELNEYYEKRSQAIDKAKEEGDVEKYYSLIDKDNEYDVRDFCDYVDNKVRKEFKVWYRVAPEITGLEFFKNMYFCLDTYNKLGMPLPNEINANYEEFSKSKDPDCKVITLGNYVIAIDTRKPDDIYTSIHVNKEMFSPEFQSRHPDYIHEIFRTFFHEVGHHLHFKNARDKFNAGLESILEPEERKTFDKFIELYNKHYADIAGVVSKKDPKSSVPARDCFSTNQGHSLNNSKHNFMIYNMTELKNNWNIISSVLADDKLLPEAVSKDFNEELRAKMPSIMNKMINAIELVKENLPSDAYALCNPAETVAEATKEELDGHPLSRAFRELLYKLGKPQARNMSYLDEHKAA